jgi:hypothetical protein
MNFLLSFLFLLFLGNLFIPTITCAQERDTSRTLDLKQKEERELRIDFNRQQMRPMSGGEMTEMGTYNMPSETQFYEIPFRAQEDLDRAVEAYREEIREKGPAWLWRTLRTISPFINNQFGFGVYDIYDLPIVERDNPGFQSKNEDKKE